jgi:glycosyltransferase involved in cell wall biosynthesis
VTAEPCEPGPPAGGPTIGFACAWDPDPVRTWSYTPWNLRAGMRLHARVVDVGVEPRPPVRAAFKALHVRRRYGRTVTTWKHSAAWAAWCRRTLGRATRAGCDAVLEIQDLAPLDLPFLVYQDLSYDVLLRQQGDGPPSRPPVPQFPMLTLDQIRRRRDRQRDIYERAAGVLAMSHWFARTLVEWTGLPAAKVHVVHPGATATGGGPPPVRDRPRTRLLLVGRDFHRKGGDLAVAALALLRRDHDPRLTLTIAGPDHWPLPGGVPDGVTFLGRLPAGRLSALYDDHDLLVMPSRFEGFGIVFAEALARGLPCVGRDAFAMPELITPGETGALVRGDDPAEVADAVARVLGDDRLYDTCRARAPTTAAHFTWSRAGRDAVAAVTAALGAGAAATGGPPALPGRAPHTPAGPIATITKEDP